MLWSSHWLHQKARQRPCFLPPPHPIPYPSRFPSRIPTRPTTHPMAAHFTIHNSRLVIPSISDGLTCMLMTLLKVCGRVPGLGRERRYNDLLPGGRLSSGLIAPRPRTAGWRVTARARELRQSGGHSLSPTVQMSYCLSLCCQHTTTHGFSRNGHPDSTNEKLSPMISVTNSDTA